MPMERPSRKIVLSRELEYEAGHAYARGTSAILPIVGRILINGFGSSVRCEVVD